jgi:hypothetical protein
MTHYTTEQLADFPWIVSCDTLRSEDLLVKFWSAAETLAVLADRPHLLHADTLTSLQTLVGEDSRESDWNDDAASHTLDELFEALNDAAPVGFGFGASEGDGACFGFGLSEDWTEALETLGLGNDDPTGWAELIARLESDGIEPDSIEDSYQGRAEGWCEDRAGADYAQQLAEELSPSFELDRTGSIPWPHRHVDWEAAWRELQMGDGYCLHDIGGGEWLVFRNV